MEGSSQALWEHGKIWCGGSLQRGAELCGEADGPSSLVGSMEGCLEPENYHSFGGGLAPSRWPHGQLGTEWGLDRKQNQAQTLDLQVPLSLKTTMLQWAEAERVPQL